MHILVKAGIGFGTIAGVAGVSYGVYSAMQPTPEKSTYAKELNGTLLTAKGTAHQAQWNARLTSLKSATTETLVSELDAIKKKNDRATWEELRDWCKNNIDNQSKGEENKEFLNIQAYCTFSIKEKLQNTITDVSDGNDNEWAVGHTALQSIHNDQLVPELQTAKSQTGETANASIKAWCNKALTNSYRGENDKEFKNAKKACVTQ